MTRLLLPILAVAIVAPAAAVQPPDPGPAIFRFESVKPALDESWKPYLDGRGTRDEAVAALVARTAEPRR